MEDEGPQPPIPYEPTMHFRWKLSPVPGDSATLQQLWLCADINAVVLGSHANEEWRDVPYVDWNGRSVV